jgi:small conductance mechanosensitive channel
METLRELVDLPRLTTTLVEYLPRVGLAVALFVLFLLLHRASRRPLMAALVRLSFHEKMVELLVDRIYKYTLVILGLVMAADQLGVNIGAALAGLGVAGIAIGFAAQDSVANVISGILIFWDKPFVVGDWITTEGHYGCVSDITLRTTRIRTPRNTYVVIPNKRIIDEVLENHSKHGEIRVDVPVGIAYKEDIRKARTVLLDAVKSMKEISHVREPDVVVEELGGSSVNLKVRVWIEQPSKQQATFAGIVEICKLSLDEAGIQIPFPHLQLFVDDVQEPVWQRAAGLIGTSAGKSDS